MKLATRLTRAAMAGVVLTAGCRTGADRPVLLVIDPFETPGEVAANGTLSVQATANHGGCVAFDRFEVARPGGEILVTAHGIDHGGPGIACTQELRLTTRTLTVPGPFTDPLTVKAMQPSGQAIVRVVRVR